MTDHPIIFSAPMIMALLAGRKTMTRRLAWRQVQDNLAGRMNDVATTWQRVKPGDRLWVRETWVASANGIWTAGDVTRNRHIVPMDIIYAADGPQPHGWFSPIHMPRWASRLTLIVTATKIERLQEISEDDARAEGCEWLNVELTSRRQFSVLWGELHGDDAWNANPEVVALTFTVHKTNIDAMPKVEAA